MPSNKDIKRLKIEDNRDKDCQGIRGEEGACYKWGVTVYVNRSTIFGYSMDFDHLFTRNYKGSI